MGSTRSSNFLFSFAFLPLFILSLAATPSSPALPLTPSSTGTHHGGNHGNSGIQSSQTPTSPVGVFSFSPANMITAVKQKSAFAPVVHRSPSSPTPPGVMGQAGEIQISQYDELKQSIDPVLVALPQFHLMHIYGGRL